MTPCIWITGLSASGKSTFAQALKEKLDKQSVSSYILDGDELRKGLCSDLSLTPEDRSENIRRMAHVAKIVSNTGTIPICAIISPYINDRENARKLFEESNFIEIYLSTKIEVCAARDPKGLYMKAKQGKIKGMTGIDAPYEAPINPELTFDTAIEELDEMVNQLLEVLLRKKQLSTNTNAGALNHIL
ncbi:adenylyl-sulfate kinase [Marinomonas mediterranea]|jgi:adenylylsulfate kinase (EC 2.7.1.25)|uniref:Adenylyl-sulfate kinase n=1 Tax=Marinomonas mediterranea (strain ATCC 700492 / JCM 21426 / NBRC 103028 / MMB-1) TaxID=717774 RepID=F2K4B5_MARM1|nr:adenylyl-sulfate kinase [Marinomonas mediterranea]ADZ92556.1 Adenylyl-sulfate kinase [Marinomonas mediterranea MMB-1]WCN10500.1 adenylyl-sulfate kinase [Marinomonas mediterranea]WCN14550.1 adenylyl-sulfate kinase [Marinomonas mediterranea]WCN18600.1 adenylyl-sulfate kinase [Marinomonas mediterranea MMB-1]